MSYARLSADSDVYVYQSSRGIECQENHADGKAVWFSTRLEAMAHLLKHVAAGQLVPDYVFTNLVAEYINDEAHLTNSQADAVLRMLNLITDDDLEFIYGDNPDLLLEYEKGVAALAKMAADGGFIAP